MKPPAFRPQWHNALMSDKERGYAHRVDFRAGVDRVTELEAHIDVFEPGRRLRLIYLRSPGLPPADSVIIDDFILDPVSGATIVRLLGSGIPATREWDTQYRRLRTGWQQAMTRLKVLLERPAGPGATP